jgi:hypothetical protein
LEASKNKLAEILDKHEQKIATGWLERQSAGMRRLSNAEQKEVTRQSREFLKAVKTAAQGDGAGDLSAPVWNPVRARQRRLLIFRNCFVYLLHEAAAVRSAPLGTWP